MQAPRAQWVVQKLFRVPYHPAFEDKSEGGAGGALGGRGRKWAMGGAEADFRNINYLLFLEGNFFRGARRQFFAWRENLGGTRF